MSEILICDPNKETVYGIRTGKRTLFNFFLDGNFSPVHEERDAEDMVVGAIPKTCKVTFFV